MGGRTVASKRLLVRASLCGASFLVVKASSTSTKVSQGITPHSSDLYMSYFVLTGLHAFHLLLGLAVLVALFFLARKPSCPQPSSGSSRRVPASGMWWTCCGSSISR